MLKISLFLLALTLSFQSFAEAPEVEMVKDLKILLSDLENESSEQLQTETGKRFKLSLGLFEEAWAVSEANCFYGGWPSSKVNFKGKKLCTSPKNLKQGYDQGNCGANQIQCQTVLFGKGLCVSFATRSQRIHTFRNCEEKFNAEKRDYTFVKDFSAEDREALKLVASLAQKLCQDKSTGSQMCRKILQRVKKTDAAELLTPIPGSEDTVPAPTPADPDLKSPVEKKEEAKKSEEESVNIYPLTVEEVKLDKKADTAPALTEAECAQLVDENIENITELSSDMMEIINSSKFGDTKMGWERVDPRKEKVVDLQEEIYCLELLIFKTSNNLDLEIDCSANPKKVPPMHVELIKHMNGKTVDEINGDAINDQIGIIEAWIKNIRAQIDMGKFKGLQTEKDLEEKIVRKKEEMECMKAIATRRKCLDGSSEPNAPKYKTVEDYLAASKSVSQVTLYVENKGRLLPFKTFDELVIPPGIGPKIKQGDFMTPEGTFKLGTGSQTHITKTDYFTSAHIDYENWSDRDKMLEKLSEAEIKPKDKGGDVLIHGSGGSVGCLSFKNSEAAYFTAMVKTQTINKQPLRMSIYPNHMTEEFVASASGNKYQDFWNKLKKTYEKDHQRTDPDMLTINEIYKK